MKLTPRELQILRGIADGLTTDEQAAALGLGASTVKTHRRKLHAKLGARNPAHVVAIAFKRGLLRAFEAPSGGQFGLLHVKAAKLAQIEKREKAEIVRELLAEAAEALGRPVESTKDLSRMELSEFLIDKVIARLKGHGAE